MSAVDELSAAFLLSLIGGVLMLLSGVVMGVWFSLGMPVFGGMMGGMGSMMGGYTGMMGSVGFGSGFFSLVLVFGLVSGVVVLVGAFMLRSRPREAATWGVLILVFSLVSLVGMGGFFIGAVLGLVGGILALTWKPAIQQTLQHP